MKHKIKPIQCRECNYYIPDLIYRLEGQCSFGGRHNTTYTREDRVCNLLDTDEKRRNAKKII